MQLSQLVRFRNNLEAMQGNSVLQAFEPFDSLLHLIKDAPQDIDAYMVQAVSQRQAMFTAAENFHQVIRDILHQTDETIEQLEKNYFVNSYRLYAGMQSDTPELILNRRLDLSQHHTDFIINRVRTYNGWKSVAAVIHPGQEIWINEMVACDPLYVIDTNHVLFEPVKKNFNVTYTNRLRFYRISEAGSQNMLQDIPDGQLAFVLAYNFFHYRPFDVLRTYLTEVYKKLIPGGCFAFTFNDCSRWGAVELAEKSYMCYTPGRLVRQLCENLGYQLHLYQELDNATTWIEIKKPGEFHSLKGGQTLARIQTKNISSADKPA